MYETIPILIDTNKLCATFINYTATELYETTLKSCTCSDFKNTNSPCCHIYRLFSALSTDKNIPNGIIDIGDDLLSKFYSLSNNCKQDFINKIIYIHPSGLDSIKSDSLSSQIEVGLWIISDSVDYESLLMKMTKDEIILALAKKGIQGFRPSWTKVKLVSWVIDEQQDFLHKHFNQYVHISADEAVIAWREAIRISKDSSTFIHPRRLEEIL